MTPTSAVKLCCALSMLLMSRTHIKTEILVGPEPALGRSIRVGVSELWANSIDAARSATTSINLLRCRLSGVRLFVSVMFTKVLFASLLVGPDLLFAGEKLLESRVVADRIPHRINSQHLSTSVRQTQGWHTAFLSPYSSPVLVPGISMTKKPTL